MYDLILVQSLKEAMQNRKERWKKFRHLISQRARTSFTLMLSERQFRGKLFTNHERRELDMTVRDYFCVFSFWRCLALLRAKATIFRLILRCASPYTKKGTGRTRYNQVQCSRTPDQNTIRRRKVVCDNLLTSFSLGSHGLADSMLGWIVSFPFQPYNTRGHLNLSPRSSQISS